MTVVSSVGQAGSRRTLRIVSECASIEEFLEAFRGYCDGESIFVSTTTPRRVGASLSFRMTLANGEPMIVGSGDVVEAFPDARNDHGLPGMRIKFKQIDIKSRVTVGKFEAGEVPNGGSQKIACTVIEDGGPKGKPALPPNLPRQETMRVMPRTWTPPPAKQVTESPLEDRITLPIKKAAFEEFDDDDEDTNVTEPPLPPAQMAEVARQASEPDSGPVTSAPVIPPRPPSEAGEAASPFEADEELEALDDDDAAGVDQAREIRATDNDDKLTEPATPFNVEPPPPSVPVVTPQLDKEEAKRNMRAAMLPALPSADDEDDDAPKVRKAKLPVVPKAKAEVEDSWGDIDDWRPGKTGINDIRDVAIPEVEVSGEFEIPVDLRRASSPPRVVAPGDGISQGTLRGTPGLVPPADGVIVAPAAEDASGSIEIPVELPATASGEVAAPEPAQADSAADAQQPAPPPLSAYGSTDGATPPPAERVASATPPPAERVASPTPPPMRTPTPPPMRTPTPPPMRTPTPTPMRTPTPPPMRTPTPPPMRTPTPPPMRTPTPPPGTVPAVANIHTPAAGIVPGPMHTPTPPPGMVQPIIPSPSGSMHGIVQPVVPGQSGSMPVAMPGAPNASLPGMSSAPAYPTVQGPPDRTTSTEVLAAGMSPVKAAAISGAVAVMLGLGIGYLIWGGEPDVVAAADKAAAPETAGGGVAETTEASESAAKDGDGDEDGDGDSVDPVAANGDDSAASDDCSLSVESDPKRAVVYVGETKLGKTPYSGKAPCGEIEVTVRKPHYGTSRETTVLDSGSPGSLSFSLNRKRYTISVKTTPPGATVKVNGKSIGNSPASTKVPAFAKAKVLITKSGYKSWSKIVRPKKNTRVTAKLRKTSSRRKHR